MRHAARAAPAAAARTARDGCETMSSRANASKPVATIASAAALEASRSIDSASDADPARSGARPRAASIALFVYSSPGRITRSLPPDPRPSVATGGPLTSDDPVMARVNNLSASSCAFSPIHGAAAATRAKNSGYRNTNRRQDFGRHVATSAAADSAASAASVAACGARSASHGPALGSAAV